MPRTKQVNKSEDKPFSNFGVGSSRTSSCAETLMKILADAPKIALPALVLAAGR
jgi:alpha-beta hydrolase superfamily lysophospholipase